MKCKKCGETLTDEDEYCPECGKKVTEKFHKKEKSVSIKKIYKNKFYLILGLIVFIVVIAIIFIIAILILFQSYFFKLSDEDFKIVSSTPIDFWENGGCLWALSQYFSDSSEGLCCLNVITTQLKDLQCYYQLVSGKRIRLLTLHEVDEGGFGGEWNFDKGSTQFILLTKEDNKQVTVCCEYTPFFWGLIKRDGEICKSFNVPLGCQDSSKQELQQTSLSYTN